MRFFRGETPMRYAGLSKKELIDKLQEEESNQFNFLKRCYEVLGIHNNFFDPHEGRVIEEINNIKTQLAKHKKPKGAWKERIVELERELELENEYIKGMKDAK